MGRQQRRTRELRKENTMENSKLYKFSANVNGQMIESIFIAIEEDVEMIIDQTVHFSPELYEESSAPELWLGVVDVKAEMFTVLSENQETIAELYKAAGNSEAICGPNPIEWFDWETYYEGYGQ